MKTTLFATCALLVALFVGATGFAQHKEEAKRTPAAMTAASFRADMRKLWSDHVIWTRVYVIASVGNQPDTKASSTRLLKNQDDIGAAIVPFYGKEAGDKLASLLKDHITIAVALINAAKSGDKKAYAEQDTKWTANGEEIAEFLSKANPNWPKATLSEMMKKHLTTTVTEVVARLEKRWDDDVEAFDEVYDHMLEMSDALADGIIKQFPDKFAK